MRPAVFFDRDGVVNELVLDPVSGLPESPLSVDDVRLIPGAAAALRRLQDSGFAIVGVSNQPGAAKDKVDLAVLQRVQAEVLRLLAEERVRPDGFEVCFHHPEGTHSELGRSCDCRKPAPGMLLRAAAALGLDLPQSWTLGDTDGDVTAGAAAGTRTILIENPASAHKRTQTWVALPRAASLADAADVILGEEKAAKVRT